MNVLQNKLLLVSILILLTNLAVSFYLIKVLTGNQVEMNIYLNRLNNRLDVPGSSLKKYFEMANSETKNAIEVKIDELVASLTAVQGEMKNIIYSPKPQKYDFSHLTQKTQYVYGPIQDDEGVFLYGLVKALRPKTMIEFGFSSGYSSVNFLKALDDDSKLDSYDITLYNPSSPAFNDPRFKFHLKSQTEFVPEDIENRTIDFAYMDAGHLIEIQTVAFEKITKQMSPVGVIAVHDTGLHYDDLNKLESELCACDFDNYCGRVHQMGERVFINWILEKYPDWQVVNLHSFSIFRHGLTLLQKKYKLSTQKVENNFCDKIHTDN